MRLVSRLWVQRHAVTIEDCFQRQEAMVKRRRRSHSWKWRALAFAVAVGLALFPSVGLGSAHAKPLPPVLTASSVIPLREQPFYPSLKEISSSWTDIVLGQVVGDSPKVTLLNFHAVMAKAWTSR